MSGQQPPKKPFASLPTSFDELAEYTGLGVGSGSNTQQTAQQLLAIQQQQQLLAL